MDEHFQGLSQRRNGSRVHPVDCLHHTCKEYARNHSKWNELYQTRHGSSRRSRVSLRLPHSGRAVSSPPCTGNTPIRLVSSSRTSRDASPSTCPPSPQFPGVEPRHDLIEAPMPRMRLRHTSTGSCLQSVRERKKWILSTHFSSRDTETMAKRQTRARASDV